MPQISRITFFLLPVRRLLALILCICAINGNLHGQNARVIDSLKLALKKAKHDTVRYHTLVELSFWLRKSSPDSSMLYAKTSLSLASKMKDAFRITSSMGTMARIFEVGKKYEDAIALRKRATQFGDSALKTEKGKNITRLLDLVAFNYQIAGSDYLSLNRHEEAIEHFKLALNLFTKTNNKHGIIWNEGTLGTTYYELGKHKESLQYKFSALERCNDSSYFETKGVLLGNIGLEYRDMGLQQKALHYLNQALAIDSAIGKIEGFTRHTANMSSVYRDRGDYSSAAQMLYRALKLAEQKNEPLAMSHINDALGLLAGYQENYSDAVKFFSEEIRLLEKSGMMEYTLMPYNNIVVSLTRKAFAYNKAGNVSLYNQTLDEALKLAKNVEIKAIRLNDQIARASALEHQSSIYKEKKNFKLSLSLLLESIKINEKYARTQFLAAIYSNLAQLYFDMNKNREAEFHYKRSLSLAKNSFSLKDLRYAYDGLYKLYKRTDRHSLALECYEQSIKLKDSLVNDENSKVLVKQQLKYEYEKQAAADSVAHAKENEVRTAELLRQAAELKAKKNQQYALFGGLGLVMVFAGFMYNRFKITHKQKKIIEIQKSEVESQKHLVEEKQREILDSIHYARRIQLAQIPSEKRVANSLQRLRK